MSAAPAFGAAALTVTTIGLALRGAVAHRRPPRSLGGHGRVRTAGSLTRSAPPWVMALAGRALRHHTDRRREAQLPGLLDAVEAGLRAGLGLVQALDAAVATTPEPLGTEVGAVMTEVAHGAPVAAALARWEATGAPGSPVALTATALALAADAGGEVARAVGRVAATLRERREVQAEVRALAAQARASAAVLAIAPIGFSALVATVEPATVQFLVATPTGWACLAAGLSLEAAGALWMARILRSVA